MIKNIAEYSILALMLIGLALIAVYTGDNPTYQNHLHYLTGGIL